MRISKIGLGTTKLDNLDAMFPGQDILIKTGQLVQYASGVFGLNHVPLAVKQNVEEIIRKEFASNDIIEVLLPSIHPKSTWERSGRYETYVNDGTMLITETGNGTFCLQPTAEEAIIEFVESKLNSYKQLPVILYQMNDKFRNEIRNRGYMFRGKLFTMMDAYSFDDSIENSIKSYEKIRKSYLNIFKQLGLNVIPVAADSGSIGGSKSEEFMMLSPLGEDTILYNKELNLGLNTEILEHENYMEILKENYNIDSLEGFEEVRSIELGHIFQLGTLYSDKMKSTFTTKDEKQNSYVMGCYGIGVTRVVATIFEEFILKENDKVIGFSLPMSITPFIGTIVSSEERKDEAEILYNSLTNINVNVILDDRYDKKTTFGVKLKDALIYGAPYTFILGNKLEDNMVEVKNNKTGEVSIINIDELQTLSSLAFSQKKLIEDIKK